MTVLNVNGEDHSLPTRGRTLLDVLRDDLNLKGAKLGCGEGECGACTVLIDGQAMCACLQSADTAVGRRIETVESFSKTVLGQQVVDELVEKGAVQCGFCTPGIVMAAADYLQKEGPQDLEAALEGNLCRCTGYMKIRQALDTLPRDPKKRSRKTRDLSLADATALLTENNTLVPIAGGTDLMVALEHRLGDYNFLDLSRIDEPSMHRITLSDNEISIGSMVTWSQMLSDPVIAKHVPLFSAVAREVGGAQVRNAGTLGGNLASSSPAGDSLPALVALESIVVIQSNHGTRELLVSDFLLGPKRNALNSGELIRNIVIPRKWEDREQRFKKVGPRKAQAISKLSLAIVSEVNAGRVVSLSIAFGACGPVPMTCPKTTQLILQSELSDVRFEKILRSLEEELEPIDDFRSTKGYRTQVAARVLWSALRSDV